MKETLPSTATEVYDEHIDSEGEYTEGDLAHIDVAAHGAETVLELALKHGEPRSEVVNTDRGPMGFVASSIPGGSVEALFSGVGPDAKVRELDIHLEDGDEHVIGVRFSESGGSALLSVDGEPVRSEDLPSVAAIVEHIKAEQAQDNESSQTHDDIEKQRVAEASEDMTSLEAMNASLDDIGARLEQAQEKLEGVQTELGEIGEALGKFFEILIEFFVMLQEELNSIADETDNDKKEEMKKDLQKKIDEFAARIASVA